MNEQEREAFEAWWPSVGQTIGKVAAWEAWQARAALAAKAVPARWKLVPVDPTPKMWAAARAVPEPVKPYPMHYALVWDAMLDAAPPAPAPEATPAQAQQARCHYCDDTGDVHSQTGEWRGECNQCPAAALHAFKNFHRLLCERFDYSHDEKDWQRDQLSLIEFIAARLAAPVAQAEPRKPLTEQEVAEAVFDYYQHFIDPQDAAEACFDKDLAMFRLAERACAEAWGVKLTGIRASTKDTK